MPHELTDLTGYVPRLVELPATARFDPGEEWATYEAAINQGVETAEGMEQAFRDIFGVVAQCWAAGWSQQAIMDAIVGGAHDAAAEGRAIRCTLVPLIRAMVKHSFIVMRNVLWCERMEELRRQADSGG